MGFLTGLKPGTWWTSSKTDSRFDMSGSGQVGMLGLPPDAETAIKAKCFELKLKKPPDDLEYGYMKA